MKRMALWITTIMIMTLLVTACSTNNEGSDNSKKSDDKLVMVWLPNESGEDIKAARETIGKVIEYATGKKVEHKITTDYIIAIESLANGSADIAFTGAQGYVEARNKNGNVEAVVVNSGESGTLDDAIYYSWIGVKKGNEDQYKSGDAFSLDNIVGKRFSFVSNSSTSGFKVPSAGIISYFNKQDKYKDLKAEDLLEGSDKGFFSKVLFGGSHQGSAVNLLTDKADVAAFCDTCLQNYVDLAEGTDNRAGAVYEVKKDAAEPFNTLVGEKFEVISVTPVLNGPISVNKDKISSEDIEKIVAALTSDETANNKEIFVPKDTGAKGIFTKSKAERFVKVTDDFFNPVRELSN
ncbi:MAG: phosphate/phosphite/phosphonate ABC transporter substrate-binding protein [Gorillibacterium sp.]|nr:phosphate/phosphite/phosphonate ABC transporter substrate-binding protein [Gorillibacterium sp.]